MTAHYPLLSMLTEPAVRQATLNRINRRWGEMPETLVVEELGTHFGASRIDVAVVNGALWGFEIKSAADRLGRLPGQAEAFSQVFDYVTLVAAGKHLSRSMELVPEWWGVVEACPATSGVRLKELRKPRRNACPNSEAVAGLLWRSELLIALERASADSGVRSADRQTLIRRLAEHLSASDLGVVVREALRARQEWRVGPGHTRDDERWPPEQTSSGFLARRVRQPRPKSTGPRR